MKKEQKLSKILFAVYLVILTWIILFKMQVSIGDLPHIRNINLIPYGQSVIVNGKIDFGEMIDNAIVFIPVGVYIAILWRRRSFLGKVLPIAGISLLYEVLQYIFAIGATDITDLIHNTVGGIIGIFIALSVFKIFPKQANRILNVLAMIGTILVLGFIIVIFVVN